MTVGKVQLSLVLQQFPNNTLCDCVNSKLRKRHIHFKQYFQFYATDIM
jgi:hypothetical protein